MVCLYCRKQIGLLRRITDPNFCSGDHRKKYNTRSARAIREAEELYGNNEDTWVARWSTTTDTKQAQSKPGNAAQATVVFGVLGVGCLLLALATMPAPNSGPSPLSPSTEP